MKDTVYNIMFSIIPRMQKYDICTVQRLTKDTINELMVSVITSMQTYKYIHMNIAEADEGYNQ